MKPADLKSSANSDFGIENNDKDPKFKLGDHVIISKYKNILTKECAPNRTGKVFVVKKVRNTVTWTCN